MATSKQYFNPETSIVFKGSGGDVTFTIESTADAALAVSAQYDRGSGAKPGLYRWFARVKGASNYTAGREVRFYLAQAKDSTDVPGRLGTSDTEISSAAGRLPNLDYVGSIIADSTSSSYSLIKTGVVFIRSRYVTVCLYNDLGLALTGTASDHYLELQPLPAEQQ